jgi:hypothetical protein
MVVITLGFIQYRMVDGQIGAYYIMIYLIMITFSVIQNAQGIPMQYIFRSKYILYGIYAFWAFTRINLAPWLMPVFCLVMTFSVVQSYLRLKRGFFWKYDFPLVQKKDQETRAAGGAPPRFWPSLNVLLPALCVALILFLGAFTQIRSMVEPSDLKPAWRESGALPLVEDNEIPRAVAAWEDGWLISTYNRKSRFSRIYWLDMASLKSRGTFQVPWAMHRDHGAFADRGRLYVADRLSGRVFDIDIKESLELGIAVFDGSFDTTLRAPVGCALAKINGEDVMLIPEYMNLYKTLVVDHELAFELGTARGATRGWYRNLGFSRGIATGRKRVLEINSSLWRDIIYVTDPQRALAEKYLRRGLIIKIAAPRWRCRDLAVSGDTIALVDGKRPILYFADMPEVVR